MTKYKINWQKKFELILKLFGWGFLIFLFGNLGEAKALEDRPRRIIKPGTVTVAQIIPDNTLGNENSQVIPNQNINDLSVDLIEGGAQRGQNLFHSFSQFNIEAEQGAYFANPEGIANIFSRVTGNDVSDILGTLGVNGNADLFLINPNGIIFGKNASLDLNGSFLATTVDAIQFGELGEFNAVNPNIPPLLTVQPSALLMNQIQSGKIESKSIAIVGETASGNSDILGLKVPDNENLTLIGGDVIIDGGLEFGGLAALDGRIELGGLAEPGVIKLNEDGSLSFPPNVARADVFLKNLAILDVSKFGSGSIALTANNIEISNSEVFAQAAISSGKSDIQPGNIFLDASENILITEESRIDNSTFQEIDAGRIDIKADESLTINNSNVFNVVSKDGDLIGSGNAGGIYIVTKDLAIEDESEVSSSTVGTGNAGQINIQADSVLATNGSRIVNQTQSTGNANNIDVQTNSLMLLDGGVITNFTVSEGNAGNIKVHARSIVLSGTAPLKLIGFSDIPGGFSSGLLTTTELGSSGMGGTIEVNTDSLEISQGAVISTRTINDALGGKITVNANILSIDRGGQILTSAFSSGNAGNIELNITEKLDISRSDPTFFDRPEAVIELYDQAALITPEIAQFLNEEQPIDPVSPLSGIFTNTGDNSTGNGGDLSLQTETLTLEDGANISASTTSGEGGNITIEAEFAIGSGNSDIVANAFEGSGGSIEINAKGIFGLSVRNELTDSNDITAFSEQNPQLNGTVDINTTEVDRNLGLLQLPSNPISARVVQACRQESSDRQSKFIISGRGGLPDSPQTNLSNDFGLEDWRVLEDRDISVFVSDERLYETSRDLPQHIVEANKLVFDNDGTIMLVADNSTNKLSNLTQKLPTNCFTN